jgi:hypothetical protein
MIKQMELILTSSLAQEGLAIEASIKKEIRSTFMMYRCQVLLRLWNRNTSIGKYM